MTMGPEKSPVHQRNENEHLSVSFGQDNVHPTHKRSVSDASSTRTRFDPSDEEDQYARIYRRQTQIAEVDLSYLDLIKGLFTGVKKLKQRLAASMESRTTRVPEGNEYDDEDCPYILTVTVWPRLHSENLRQRAKCILDTGCLQGNIISKRLATSLGFTVTEYEQLKPREKTGGITASGHIHHAIGAIRVSWSHGSSTRMMTLMRFLVSDNEKIDLVIGARSIRKWNLISPPNLSNVPDNIADLQDDDPEGDRLGLECARIEGEIIRKKQRLNGLDSGNPDRAKLQREIEKRSKKLKIAEQKRDAYNARMAKNENASKS